MAHYYGGGGGGGGRVDLVLESCWYVSKRGWFLGLVPGNRGLPGVYALGWLLLLLCKAARTC